MYTTLSRLLDCFAGSEHALLVFSGFPALFKEGMREAPKEWKPRKQALAMLCFFTRAYNYPDDIFNNIQASVNFPALHQRFYKVFQAAFCKNEPKVSVVTSSNMPCTTHSPFIACRRTKFLRMCICSPTCTTAGPGMVPYGSTPASPLSPSTPWYGELSKQGPGTPQCK